MATSRTRESRFDVDEMRVKVHEIYRRCDVLQDFRPSEWFQQEDVHIALSAFGLLSQEALQEHAAAIARCLKDEDWDVRKHALDIIGGLSVAALQQYASAIAVCFQDEVATIRDKALDILLCISPEALEEHAGAIVGCFQDEDADVRNKALDASQRLSREALQAHACAIVKCLRNEDARTRFLALGALHRLGQEVLQQHPRVIAECLQDESFLVRDRAFEMVETLRCTGALQEHADPREVEVVSLAGERFRVGTYSASRVSDLAREVERAASKENNRAATPCVGGTVLDPQATIGDCMKAGDQVTVAWRPRCRWEVLLLEVCHCSGQDATEAILRHGVNKNHERTDDVVLHVRDVELVVSQVQCSPVDAAAALLRVNNDVVEAIMYLSDL